MQPDLINKLDTIRFMPGKCIYVRINIFKNLTYISLDHHFVTWRLIPETMIDIQNKISYILQGFIASGKYNKWQIITLLKRCNIFLIYLTTFRCNQIAGKNNVRHRIGSIAGNLSDAVKDISIYKNAVAGIQSNMFFADLIIQYSGFCRCNFKSRVPMQRAALLPQGFQLIMEKRNRKDHRIIVDLLFQLTINNNWHYFLRN